MRVLLSTYGSRGDVEPINTHRATIGLPPVDDVGPFMFTARPLLAADPILGPWSGPEPFDVMQTGAWILPDERPLPAELLRFLDAGEPPVYVGFGSMRTVDAAGARTAIDAIRAQDRRVLIGRGWAGLAPGGRSRGLLRHRRCQPAGAVHARGCRRASRRRGHHDRGGPRRRAAGGGAPRR
ncbi:MAG TPA: hypothetical protein VFW27_12020 [Actinoplanes sp.]|jgi:vancomycin aglycone glucosyltransferase|nr:hypothetical protein [Actinoplanes sp.]